MAARSRHILVSGFFGESEITIHKAPKGTKAVFFTNNQRIEETARAAGWHAIRKDDGDFALSPDVRISSIQSKYVKFLQFRHHFPVLAQFDMITYCDHRACVQDKQLVELFTKIDPACAVLVRNSPKLKTLPQEVEISKRQPRYAHSMDKTTAWLDQLKQRHAIRDDLQIANTGVLHTTNVKRMMSLFDEVYQAVIDLGQPQCQIIWAGLSQQYASDIHHVEWSDINIPWGASPVDRRAALSPES